MALMEIARELGNVAGSNPSRGLRLVLSAVVALVLVGVAPGGTTYQVTIINSTGGTVDDIHLIFTNTGNTVANRSVLAPVGGVVTASAGNAFDAAFTPALANNGAFIGQFDANFPNVAFDSGNWSINGAVGVPIQRTEVKFQVVPEPATFAALGLGVWAVLRRRKS